MITNKYAIDTPNYSAIPFKFNTSRLNCTNREDVKVGTTKGVALAANLFQDKSPRK